MSVDTWSTSGTCLSMFVLAVLFLQLLHCLCLQGDMFTYEVSCPNGLVSALACEHKGSAQCRLQPPVASNSWVLCLAVDT